MKKRDFLKGGAATLSAAALTGTVAADKRLYGTPASLVPTNPTMANKLRLGLARSSIPTPIWDELVSFSTGLTALESSAVARAQFSASPSAYFEAIGVKTSAQFDQSREVALARLVTDETARIAAANGDYVGFLKRFTEFNLPAIPDSQGLMARLVDLLRTDINAYEAARVAIERAGGTSLSQAVSSAIPPCRTGSTCFTNVYVAAEAVVVAVVAVAVVVFPVAVADGEQPIANGVSRLDPRIIEGAASVVSAARLMGNKEFEMRAVTEMVNVEVEAMIGAIEAVGLIQVDTEQRALIIQAGKDAANRSLGLKV